jgi:FkbM family methyltransferase
MNYLISDSCQIDHEYLNELYLKIFGYINNGFFVEIGAYDGISFSNTWGLSKAGWSGLYVEPAEELLERCKANHKFNKNIQYFNCAVSNFEGTARFYLGDWGSTICENLVIDNHPYLNKNNYRIVKVFTLDYVLELFKVPVDFNLLVVDCEGEDLEVLKSFSIDRYKPKMIIVEYQHETFDEFMKYFNLFNYKLENKDSCNLIYLRGDIC